MFAVIYQAYLKPGREEDYQKAWCEVVRYFIEKRGALGSCLHRAADGLWVAYSRWPDKETRDLSWPGENEPSQDISEEIRNAIRTLQDCLDPERKIPEICMEVVTEMKSR